PVRRRPARVHRGAVREAGGGDAARDDRAPMAVREPERPGAEPAGRDHPAAARGTADGRAAPSTDRRVLADARGGPIPGRDQLEVLAPLAERVLELLRQALD